MSRKSNSCAASKHVGIFATNAEIPWSSGELDVPVFSVSSVSTKIAGRFWLVEF